MMNTNMKYQVRWWLLIMTVLIGMNFSAKAEHDMSVIPTGAKGLVVIESVRNGNLLHMRGWAGEGKYVTVNKLGQRCTVDSVEFIAGGFVDTDISIVDAEPISIAVYGDNVAKRLLADQQINSQDYQVAYEEEQQAVEMQVINGILPSMTFILNPKRKWTSWFREDTQSKVCTVNDKG